MSHKITFLIGTSLYHPKTGETPTQITYTIEYDTEEPLNPQCIINQPLNNYPFMTKPLLDGRTVLYNLHEPENFGRLTPTPNLDFIQTHHGDCLEMLPESFGEISGDIFVPVYVPGNFAPFLDTETHVNYKYIYLLLHKALGWVLLTTESIPPLIEDLRDQFSRFKAISQKGDA